MKKNILFTFFLFCLTFCCNQSPKEQEYLLKYLSDTKMEENLNKDIIYVFFYPKFCVPCQKKAIDMLESAQNKSDILLILAPKSLEATGIEKSENMYIDTTDLLEKIPLHRRSIGVIYTTKGTIDSIKYVNTKNIDVFQF